MMDRKDDPSGVLLWLLQFGPVLMLVALAGVAGLTVAFGFGVDRRLDSLEEDLGKRLRYEAPRPDPAAAFDAATSPVSGHRATYVPAHSHVYIGEGEGTPLTITLSVRNTDAKASLRVHSARYYDTKGALIKEYAEQPLTVGPMATLEILIGESDLSGGSGANFIVEWSEPEATTAPILEATMIGGTGISFVQRGVDLGLCSDKSATRRGD